MPRQLRNQRQEPQQEQPGTQHEPQIAVGDRVRAKITNRIGEVTHVVTDGPKDTVIVSYDGEPQDGFLTTPARDGAELPRELVDPA